MSSQPVSPHRLALGVVLPDPRRVVRTKRLPPVVRQGLDVVPAQTLLRVLRVESQTRADRQTAVRDLVYERVMEAECSVHRADIPEVGEAPEGAGDLRWVAPRKKRGSLHVESLADDGRGLEELAIGGEQLVEASADRGLHGDGEGGARAAPCPRQLDDEQRMPLRTFDIDIASASRAGQRARGCRLRRV